MKVAEGRSEKTKRGRQYQNWVLIQIGGLVNRIMKGRQGGEVGERKLGFGHLGV